MAKNKQDVENTENTEQELTAKRVKKPAVVVTMSDGSTITFPGRQNLIQDVNYEENKLTIKTVTGQIVEWKPNIDFSAMPEFVKKLVFYALTNRIKFSCSGLEDNSKLDEALSKTIASLDAGEFVTRNNFGALGQIVLTDIQLAWIKARQKHNPGAMPMSWGECQTQEELAVIKNDWDNMPKERKNKLKKDQRVQEELIRLKAERGDLVDSEL